MEKVIEEICNQHSQKIQEADLNQKITALHKDLPKKFNQAIQSHQEVVQSVLGAAFEKQHQEKKRQVSSLDKIICETKKLALDQEESKQLTKEGKIIQFGKSLEKIEGLQSQLQIWGQKDIRVRVLIDENKLKELLTRGCTIIVESENKEILKIEPEEKETDQPNDQDKIKQMQDEEIKKKEEADDSTERMALSQENETLKQENALLNKKFEQLQAQIEDIKAKQTSSQVSQTLSSTSSTQPVEQECYLQINQGWTPWTNAPKPNLTTRSIPGVKWIGSWQHLYSTYQGYGSSYSAMYQYKVKLSIPVKEFETYMLKNGYDVERIREI